MAIDIVIDDGGGEDATTIAGGWNLIPASPADAYHLIINNSNTYQESVSFTGKSTTPTKYVKIFAKSGETPTWETPATLHCCRVLNNFVSFGTMDPTEGDPFKVKKSSNSTEGAMWISGTARAYVYFDLLDFEVTNATGAYCVFMKSDGQNHIYIRGCRCYGGILSTIDCKVI